MSGGDVKALFPVHHNEKILHLQDTEEHEEDWKSKLDHMEGLLTSRAASEARVVWKHTSFLCRMPGDIHFLFREGDINHLNNIL
jgi:hypothetical protein